MPYFSFHGGHSGEFCRHAYGTLEQTVVAAVAAGFTHLGLSEHAPRFREQDLYPEEKDLTPADLQAHFEAYVQRARELQQEYAGRLEILVGFETETVPPTEWTRRMRDVSRSGFDYFVGSVHSVGEHWIDFAPEATAAAAREAGGVEELQRAYFQQVTRLIDELRPPVVGHLDLIRKFDGQSPQFGPDVWPEIDRALEAAVAHGCVLEVNAAPARRGFGPVYPIPAILQRARHMGVRVTLGDDSHAPQDVGVGLDRCLLAIASAGFSKVAYLTRRSGVATWEEAALNDLEPRRPLP